MSLAQTIFEKSKNNKRKRLRLVSMNILMVKRSNALGGENSEQHKCSVRVLIRADVYSIEIDHECN